MPHHHDNYIIPFGKFKFTALCRLPSSYLLGLNGDIRVMSQYPEIKEWIDDNMDKLRHGNGIESTTIPEIKMPCKKYLYLTEREASKELHRIMRMHENDNRKIPVRHYYCEKCGGWHLTSKK